VSRLWRIKRSVNRLVVERYWDQARLAIEDDAWRPNAHLPHRRPGATQVVISLCSASVGLRTARNASQTVPLLICVLGRPGADHTSKIHAFGVPCVWPTAFRLTLALWSLPSSGTFKPPQQLRAVKTNDTIRPSMTIRNLISILLSL
jgi:hypothetical protein